MTSVDTVTQGNTSSNTSSLERDNTSIQVVEFLLGEERFAIDLFEVKEVVAIPNILWVS